MPLHPLAHHRPRLRSSPYAPRNCVALAGPRRRRTRPRPRRTFGAPSRDRRRRRRRSQSAENVPQSSSTLLCDLIALVANLQPKTIREAVKCSKGAGNVRACYRYPAVCKCTGNIGRDLGRQTCLVGELQCPEDSRNPHCSSVRSTCRDGFESQSLDGAGRGSRGTSRRLVRQGRGAGSSAPR